jgi:hypothetical protein
VECGFDHTPRRSLEEQFLEGFTLQFVASASQQVNLSRGAQLAADVWQRVRWPPEHALDIDSGCRH